VLGTGASLDANAGTLQAIPNPLNFGSVVLGVTSTSTVVVSNSGSHTTITGLVLTGSTDFTASSRCGSLPVALVDGESCVLNVSFRPRSVGAKSATLVVSNDGGNATSVTLEGTGGMPTALLAPSSLLFAKQAVGSTSAVQSLTVSNAGSAGSMLSIASIEISGSNAGDFALQSGAGRCTVPSNVASGASCTIGVSFTPSAPGVRTASLTVTTNDPINPTRTAHLSGGGAAIHGDINGDGRADVLWRNVANGQNYLYALDGTTIVAEGYLRTVADLTWRIAGIGDFDGDGKADILWRNTSTGDNYIYFMDGTTIAAEGYLRTVASQSWQVAGTGDFDGDGKDDILWRNSATGATYMYLMNGLQVAGEDYLPSVDQHNWRVAGVGDFDGDGKTDILWRKVNDGQNYVYLMNGTSIKHQGHIRSVAGLSWNVVGVGDFNGDGYADILWRSLSTGENYLWPMNGTTILASEGYLRTVNDQSWRIVQVGDFDGDGKADIFWRNVTTGQTYLYPMDGRSIKPTEGYVRTVSDQNWLVFSDTPSTQAPISYPLVINEVDYDSVGPGAAIDTAEFIELYNPTTTYVPTINLAVVLVIGDGNGGGQEYARISLGSSSIPPGGYLVIGNASILAALPPGTLSILIPDNSVYDGSYGGIALFDTATNTLVDALSYEGSIRAAVINGAPGTYNLVEGMLGTARDDTFTRSSLIRNPNGRDTNNALTDWIQTPYPTPGAMNVF
jgi:hypothetical protein